MTGFLDWNAAYQAGPALCGGKGYNLARLARYGFRVPRGGVLTIDAPLSLIPPALERLGLADATVAVRSSATVEDSAQASFAGIHRSFLNVHGTAAIVEAAQGCIDSLQTPEARAYRQRMGFRDEDVRCAVVICEMVHAKSAGVAFSCDPATGRRDQILIDAAEGLGENVVSGRVNPRRAVWNNYRGTLLREGPPTLASLLPAAVEEELVNIVRRVHWALGEGQDPQDVEWAWDGARLWLLQARPVTNLPRPGWPEVAAMPRYWSTANIKDAVPGVVCELSWSMLTDIVGTLAYSAQKAVDYPMPPGMEVVRRFEGRGYFDLTLMQWAFYDAFGVPPADIVKLLGGHQPEIAVSGDPRKGPEGRRRGRATLRLLRRIWSHPERTLAAVPHQLDYFRRYRDTDWTAMSYQQLLDAVIAMRDMQESFFDDVGLANSSSGPWQVMLEGIVRDPQLLARLQTGAGGVASAEQGYRLYDIATGKATLEDFLHHFGHRAVYESDGLNPRWAEDPSWVMEQVDLIRAHPPERDPRETAAAVRRDAERDLRRRFPLLSPLLLWMVRKLRRSVAAREAAKSALVSPMLPVRRIVLEIGRRLTSQGKLDTPEQTLHFASIDLACLLADYWDGTGARELAEDRRLRREAWLARTAPDLITESPDHRIVVGTTAEAVPAGAGVYNGIAIAPGVASGIARVVQTPTAASHLQQGDILVAPSTDPGWTPLFLRASAIVMETGGFLSHGAIVAREYGIPAVANIPGILTTIADGDHITVDGNTGRVILTTGNGACSPKE